MAGEGEGDGGPAAVAVHQEAEGLARTQPLPEEAAGVSDLKGRAEGETRTAPGIPP